MSELKVIPPDKLEELVSPLRDYLFTLEGEMQAIEEVYNQKQEEVAKVRSAVSALEGPSKRKGPWNKPSNKPSKRWNPSQESIDEIFNALKKDGSATQSALAEATGKSKATIQRALQLLREQERVRLAGAEEGTSAHVYTVMNGQ